MPGPTVSGFAEPKLLPVPPVPVHHVKTAPAPDTPLAVMVVVALEQIGLVVAVAEVIEGKAFTVTNCDAQVVVLHWPSYRTK